MLSHPSLLGDSSLQYRGQQIPEESCRLHTPQPLVLTLNQWESEAVTCLQSAASEQPRLYKAELRPLDPSGNSFNLLPLHEEHVRN